MTGISHPDGCRCPGCLPGQYVMKPAAPARSAATRRPANTPRAGDDLIKFDMGCLAVVLGCAALSALIGWLARLPAVAWETIGATIGILVLTVAGYLVITRPARPPKGRLHVEAGPQSLPSSLPISPPPPPCPHLNAVKVDSSYYKALSRTVIWCCWCPDCESELPASFRRPCCGTEPETRHLGNCPHSSERLDITGQWQP